jgi:uncharacterized membrane protein (DUF2068 family)
MSQAHQAHTFNHPARPNSSTRSAGGSTITKAGQRPLGLWMLPVAGAIIGAAALLQARDWLYAPDIEAGSGLATTAGIIASVLVTVAVLEIVFAYGVVGLRSWATKLGTAATITALALTLMSAGRGSSATHTLWLLLEIGTVWYLLSPRVQEVFRPRDHGAE